MEYQFCCSPFFKAFFVYRIPISSGDNARLKICTSSRTPCRPAIPNLLDSCPSTSSVAVAAVWILVSVDTLLLSNTPSR